MFNFYYPVFKVLWFFFFADLFANGPKKISIPNQKKAHSQSLQLCVSLPYCM